MKKKLGIIVSALALIVVMIAILCACSSYGSIKSAFKKEGYKEVELSDSAKAQVTAILGEDYDSKASVHFLQKEADEDSGILGQLGSALSTAIIIEFKSNKEMEETLKDNKDYISKEDVENVYEELQKLDNVSGNCIIISANPEALKIFKSTK